MGVSTVPAAITGLVGQLSTSTDLPGVHIYDGAAVIPAGIAEGVIVGWSDQDSGARAVESTADLDGLNVGMLREEYTVNCQLQVANGNSNIPAVRERAFELLATIGSVLAADPTLGGVVLNARVGSNTLSQQQTRNGAYATIHFGIVVDAFQS